MPKRGLFHQYDGPGSTDALLDEWETATDRYAYRAFGLEAARSGTTDNPFTYVGRQSYYQDPELELYLLGARYYDPQAGRFLSHDPLRYQSDDVNLYAYVHNNPVNATDPSGTGEVRGWASLSDRQKVEVWAGLPPSVRYLLSTTFWPREVLLLRGRYGRSRLLEQISVGKAELRRDLSRRLPFEGSADDQLATWPELTLIERREAWMMLPESRRQVLQLRLDRDLLRREVQQARHRIRSGGLEFPERNRPSSPVEHLVELPPDVAPRSTPPAVAPPAVPADASPPPPAAMAGSEDVSRALREMGSVLADLGRQLSDIAQGSDTGAAPQAAAPPDYGQLFQDKFDELAARYGLKELRDAYAGGRRGAEKNYLGAWRDIEGRSRQHAEDKLAEYARQAAQAIEQAEQRQGRESLLAVAETLARFRDLLDKVPLSDLAIPVVSDIIFRAAQLLTLDFDLDEARAAHRQIVEAHVNATNPGHADDDALQQAGEVHRRATGQAEEAVGGLLRLYTFIIGAAFGTAASGGARRKQGRSAQRTAKTPKGQPKKQSPQQRVVDNQKRIQENRKRAEVSTTTPKFFTSETTWRAPANGTGQTYKVFRQDIDWNLKVQGRTNAQWASEGRAPFVMKNGRAEQLQLHHSRQNVQGPLFELSRSTHLGTKSGAGREALHPYGRSQHPDFPVDRAAFNVDRGQYWIDRVTEAGRLVR